MTSEILSFHEALLGLTSVVSNADGENHPGEVDARVNMILNESISNTTIESFEGKYAHLNDIEATYSAAISSLKEQNQANQAKALAYMYLVANVASKEEDTVVDLGNLEEVEEWQNSDSYVDLEELAWINRAKKDLNMKLSTIKEAFANLPKAKRI